MSREVRRVPLDFSWPLDTVWNGYLAPDTFDEIKCPDCKVGYSPHGQYLKDLWYGNVPFDPASTGSTPLRHDTPAVRAFAERNVADAPDFYGTGEIAIAREASRLADLWNGQWCHHLAQEDVDALTAANRLKDFTHTWSRDTGWQPIEPAVELTAARINEWSLHGFGHDSINAGIAVRARCEREGFVDTCSTCHGYASTEAYPGQRAEAEAWRPAEPPAGEGWQLWTTVTEGSPISPVFPTADGLADWMSDPARGDEWVPAAVAAKFIEAGWAPSGAISSATGPMTGIEYIGHHTNADS